MIYRQQLEIVQTAQCMTVYSAHSAPLSTFIVSQYKTRKLTARNVIKLNFLLLTFSLQTLNEPNCF